MYLVDLLDPDVVAVVGYEPTPPRRLQELAIWFHHKLAEQADQLQLGFGLKI